MLRLHSNVELDSLPFLDSLESDPRDINTPPLAELPSGHFDTGETPVGVTEVQTPTVTETSVPVQLNHMDEIQVSPQQGEVQGIYIDATNAIGTRGNVTWATKAATLPNIARPQISKKEKPISTPNSSSLFVGGVGVEVPQHEVIAFFEKLGACNVVRKEGFAFVDFSQPEQAQQVLQDSLTTPYTLGGKELNFRPKQSQPKKTTPNRGRGGPPQRSRTYFS
eukprot:TRINITY_DN2302_c0_g1_i3.p1 TRINITY_DN2302_c0_g1~~TRINITY_DN2302_c0_g1_i3.p1  ORF type:complete len:222 (-),score=35.18 TRINITY_DN2302_c0_g1_i3:170-835(-)